MERRKTDRRRGTDPKQDAVAALHLARSLLSHTEKYKRQAHRISQIIDDIEDTTRTIDRRKNERREDSIRLRLVG